MPPSHHPHSREGGGGIIKLIPGASKFKEIGKEDHHVGDNLKEKERN